VALQQCSDEALIVDADRVPEFGQTGAVEVLGDRDHELPFLGVGLLDAQNADAHLAEHALQLGDEIAKVLVGRQQVLGELTCEQTLLTRQRFAFKAQAALQLADRDNAEVAWTETGYVFTMDDGRPMHPQSVSRAFDRAIAAAKLPRIRLHDLRHTHASLALAAGINPKVVSERLGHATVSITLDTYSHAIPALQEEAAERIAGLVLTG
jgi:hypothetical protein